MPFDPNSRLYRPDFQANTQLPTWTPMGEESQDMGTNVGAIGGTFKDRFMKPKFADKIQEGLGPALPSSGAGAKAGGGMQSL